MNDTKQLPDGLPSLPGGTYYAGTLADFEGEVEGWASDGPNDEWDHGIWHGMKDYPNDCSADWHVALPIKAAPKQQDDGGPAFPRPPFTPKDGHDQFAQAGFAATGHPGMSLRDWFAGMALQGIITGSANPIFDDQGRNQGLAQFSIQEALTDGPGLPQLESNSTCSNWAWIAYYTADAMLAARKEAP